MNAVVMDDAIVGENSIVGALCFVPAKMNIPAKSVVVGNPAKVVKEASEEMIAWKSKGTELYQKLPQEMFDSGIPCEPLKEVEVNRPSQEKMFQTWESIKNSK